MKLLSKLSLFVSALIIFCLLVACSGPKEPLVKNTINWAWMYINRDFSEKNWETQLSMMKNAGIDGILLLKRSEEPGEYERIARLIKSADLKIHVWIPTVNPHGAESLETNHPDWYQVNREGISCLDHPPYIPSYKWLCPNHPEAREYLIAEMDNLASEDYLDGVHLDYIRFPDVILPIGIQPKYNLVQDHEFPEFDFCYCEHCREKYKTQTGVDPMDLEDPAANQDWINFRYESINSLVNQIADKVHAHGKKITAAVFPTPVMSKQMVRQDWINWKLDAVMPMMYHQYYFEPLSWVETATQEGVEALNPNTPLFSGLFINEIKPGEFDEAVDFAANGGAKGICLFNANGMSKRQWKALKKAIYK